MVDHLEKEHQEVEINQLKPSTPPQQPSQKIEHTQIEAPPKNDE
jgi:hypothetical protein